jgi:hypothetical protein
MLTLQKVYIPMTLKMNFTKFKDLNEVGLVNYLFILMNLVFNDFCEILKFFTYSFDDV